MSIPFEILVSPLKMHRPYTVSALLKGRCSMKLWGFFSGGILEFSLFLPEKAPKSRLLEQKSGVLLELCQSGSLIESGLLFAWIWYGVIIDVCIPSKIPEWYHTSKVILCNFKFLHVSGWLMTKVLKSSLSWQICSEQGQTRSRHSPAFMVPGDTI